MFYIGMFTLSCLCTLNKEEELFNTYSIIQVH